MAGKDIGKARVYAAGDLIARQGDDGREAFLLTAGEAELTRRQADGREGAVRLLGRGSAFGEMGLIPGRAYTATVKARTGVEVLAIDAEAVGAAFAPGAGAVREFFLGALENLRVNSQGPPGAAESVGGSSASSMKPGMPDRSVWILARTALSRETLDGEASLLVTAFPYRVGRATGNAAEDASNGNDLLLKDRRPYSISRKHFSIEWAGDACCFQDAGSRLGSIVNGRRVGGNTPGPVKVSLKPGRNSVHLGARRGKLSFTFIVEGALRAPGDSGWRRLWRRLSG